MKKNDFTSILILIFSTFLQTILYASRTTNSIKLLTKQKTNKNRENQKKNQTLIKLTVVIVYGNRPK